MSALVLQGGVVHYEYFGRGRPLIFMHGWLGSWRYWVPVMDALSEEYRVYAFDLWGFGDSDKSKDRYDLQSYVSLLNAFIDELGIRCPVPLVGHALGASVAVAYARQHPKEVERIMAVGLPLDGDSINQRLRSGGGGSFINRVIGRAQGENYESVKSEYGRTAPEAIIKSVRSVEGMDLHAALKQLVQPLLLVYGEQDNVVTPHDAAQYAGVNNTVRTMMLPQCRHFPMLDRSSQFNRLLQDFLRTADLKELELKDEWVRRLR
jgi:pimeloyl-ACP methyl ester carboxylesterase